MMVPFIDVSGPKFRDSVEDPSQLPMPCRLSVASDDISDQVSNSSKKRPKRIFVPQVLRQIINAIYCLPFGNVWLSSVCLHWCSKPGSEVECRIYRGWVKTPVLF